MVTGGRSYRNTLALLRDIADRIKRGGCPLIVTDSFEFYEKIVRQLFGPAALYGQVLKTRRNDRVMQYEKYAEQGFQTPDGKAQLVCHELESIGVSALPVYREPPLSPISTPEMAAEYPLILTSGAKTVFFFHSEGRQIPSLRRRNPNPLVDRQLRLLRAG